MSEERESCTGSCRKDSADTTHTPQGPELITQALWWHPYLCSKDGVPGTQWGQINADLRDCWHVAERGAEGLQEPWCLARAPDHPQDAHTCLACKP